MIDKKILKQMGFKECGKADGWDHEVWWYPISCWVHFDHQSSAEFTRSRLGNYLIIDGESETMTNFFKLFLEHYDKIVFNSCEIVRKDA